MGFISFLCPSSVKCSPLSFLKRTQETRTVESLSDWKASGPEARDSDNGKEL